MERSWLREEANRSIVVDAMRKTVMAAALESEDKNFWHNLAYDCLFYLQIGLVATNSDSDQDKFFREQILCHAKEPNSAEELAEVKILVSEFLAWIVQTMNADYKAEQIRNQEFESAN